MNVIFILTLLAAGASSGFIAGLFGIGGGVILVPIFSVLLLHFGASPDNVMHCAIATSLALIVPGAAMSTWRQHSMGKLSWKLYWHWAPAVLLGIMIGAFSARQASSQLLRLCFTLFIYICIAMNVWQHLRSQEQQQEGIPKGLNRYLGAMIIGGTSTILGIGGGLLTVNFLRLFRYPLKNAIALSTATAMLIGFAGAILNIYFGHNMPGRAMYSWGYVNWAALSIMTPTVMLTAPLGSNAANKLPSKLLQKIYFVFLFGMAAWMTFKTFI